MVTPGETLTRSQAARRERVIGAAMALASEGGYDAVQMRDVATRADVALGTIYRYFSSKDHLLAAAMVEWTGELERKISQRPPRGDTPAERVSDVVQRATRALERNPQLTAALVTALSAANPAVVECQRAANAAMQAMLAAPMEGLDEETRRDTVRVLNHVWFSALLSWVNGWIDARQVTEELEVAARMVLPG